MSVTSNLSKTTVLQKPRHIAIVMDGNGRWAKKRLLPRIAGHRAGLETVRKIIQAARERGIEVLSLFAFSSENWRRPKQEVSFLMNLFLDALQQEAKKLKENQIRLRVVGDLSQINLQLQEQIQEVVTLTADNQGMDLVIAFNYGGRWDIVQAAKAWMKDAVLQGLSEAQIADLSETQFNQRLCLHDLPEPDLFIRTSGEMRISNFYLWQLAYTELYFTSLLWPDFDVKELDKALAFFASRERRFGTASE